MNSNLVISKYSWLFHHKYLIIDQSNTGSDPLILTGSHNWSNSGESKNDENTVVVHDATTANLFYQEFHQRWLDEVNGAGINEIINQQGNAFIFPNPANNAFAVMVDDNTYAKATVSIINVLGKQVASFTNLNNNNGLINVSDFNLADGLYLIKVSIKEKIFTSRVLINK